MEEILVVDGYNIIGAWPDLRNLKENGNLDQARDDLLAWLDEYQAYSGREVIVVFDAHQVPGAGKKLKYNRITIYFTKKNETADESIEKLVVKLSLKRKRIYVATSDYTEQKIIFGKGALRISARELLNEKEGFKKNIGNKVEKQNKKIKTNIISALDDEMIKFFENLRRKK